MDSTTLLTRLDHEYRLLGTALAAADATATVPSCPDWTAADLDSHVAHVYRHKVETMRRGNWPQPWPPSEGVGTLADAYAALQAEFAARTPSETAVTFFDSDQTVGFWIRRMAQETAIHRVDAELTAGGTITPIEDDLAVDGIDELLRVFIEFASASWPEDFAEVLATADRRPVRITTGGRDWTITAGDDRILIRDGSVGGAGGSGGDAAATISGEPSAVYRWLWNRGGDVTIDGEEALALQLHPLMEPGLQ
jgi:uncharacterized protein (TIGR03083 family)